MKQSNRATFRKLVVATGFAIVAVITAPAIAKASIGVDSVTEKEKQSNIQYLGAEDNSIWFNVKYANPTAEKFSLVIKNADGDILYQGYFSDVNFSRKIKLLIEERDVHPTFIIRKGKEEIAQSFQVNTAKRVREQVVVTRL